mmetsp:Transcript_43967/g.104054  ORF Transcript_43967/g.104054 Transcript_43967/m.104054 type:complete len:748 (+) Transcript_43967:47-2290(+)|eukprot:CAMPEP_0178425184 /NCGR_PEP_ID=MMETSP0689_2-20121128/28592_1 /TAXON_ID=160604 /ORGANISM="Amphidinium massartii, Strain CS-259" /LENGTH=747 /DNA_ID=CAMNT_0020046839 /DNA_START=19 /DNA_END=2262 /DNA_ORIENTATION=+
MCSPCQDGPQMQTALTTIETVNGGQRQEFPTDTLKELHDRVAFLEAKLGDVQDLEQRLSSQIRHQIEDAIREGWEKQRRDAVGTGGLQDHSLQQSTTAAVAIAEKGIDETKGNELNAGNEQEEAGSPKSPVSPRLQAVLDHWTHYTEELDVVTFEFEPSLWDALLFVGHRELRVAGSLWTLIVFFLCVITQMLLTVIIWNNLTGSSFPDEIVDAFKEWRLRTGHAAKYMDTVGTRTLVERVCALDRSVEVAGFQQDNLQTILKYIPQDNGNSIISGRLAGPTMCTLAVSTWCITVTLEFARVFNVVWLLRVLPTASESHLNVDAESGEWELASLAPGRRIGYAFWTATRLGLAVWLLISGIFYLVHTISIGDLVLNALALEFMLNLDELFFNMLPVRMWNLIARLKPVKLGRPVTAKYGSGFDPKGAIFITIVLISVSLTLPLLLTPEVNRLIDAHDALCSGSRRFTVVNTNFPGSTFWTDVSNYGDPLLDPLDAGEVWDENTYDRYPDEVVWRLVTSPTLSFPEQDPISGYKVQLSGAAWSLQEIELWDNKDMSTKWNPGCEDLLPYREFAVWDFPYLGAPEPLTTDATCADMQPFCNDDTVLGAKSRYFCAATCKCDNPLERVGSLTDISGCPASCGEQRQYKAMLQNASCEDTDQNWTQIAAKMRYIASSWTAFVRSRVGNVSNAVEQLGCGAVSVLRDEGADICDDTTEERQIPLVSFRFVCPKACDCWAGLKNCPYSCGSLG